MKVFGTHLPAMSRTEITVLPGQIQRGLDPSSGGDWSGWVNNPSSLSIQGRGSVGSIRCEILVSPGGDSELRVTSNEVPSASLASERAVGAAMRSIHQTCKNLLGEPPVPKIWTMTGGQLMYEPQFDS
jgi:hypothetical protein